jgi:hypothetical protein
MALIRIREEEVNYIFLATSVITIMTSHFPKMVVTSFVNSFKNFNVRVKVKLNKASLNEQFHFM